MTTNITVTTEERELIAKALRLFEDGWNTGTPDDKVYFGKVLKLADRFFEEDE